MARKERKRIDWAAVRAKLEAAWDTTDSAFSNDPERSAAILKERAQRLAEPAESADVTPKLEILSFTLGAKTFAIETQYVFQVSRLSTTEPVPNLPRQFLGITNMRGRIMPLVNPQTYFGIAGTAANKPKLAVFLGEESAELGLPVERLEGLSWVPEDTVSTPPDQFDGQADNNILKGITRSQTVLLAGDRILGDEALAIT